MSEPPLERIETLFHAAADLPSAEREPYLARECGDDDALRARVEAMLDELEKGASLPPPDVGQEAQVLEGPGSVIGRYKLLQKIGEGGFGVVYMADQEEPIVRRVALKVIKAGMDTREVVARFEAERQALAMMDHPNIARVLDCGATETGRPFFVMELVRGVSITEYCDETGLGTRERLELFVTVCQAVQHAHQKGVIHRDLKPSNVLVTLHDGKPVPKVIDFGVAKAMHTRLTEKTLFTAYGRFMGTPAYMSPEQAELSGLDVDTRADIYSLGVLLYELLTGTTPFDLASLLEEGLAAMQRTIREVVPERPSMRISTSGDAGIARRRGTDVPALSRTLRGDLDWIVMKCLEKERVRRYETASELASDIVRHLRDDPVLAGPPSAAYRLRKLLARNRGAAISLAVVLAGLVVGLVGLAWGLFEADAQRDAALQAQASLEQEVVRTRDVTDFLIETLELADPSVVMSADLSVATLLDSVSDRVESVFNDDPTSAARLHITIGRGYRALGENRRAEHHLRRGIELLDEAGTDDLARLYRALWDHTNVLFALELPDAMTVAQRSRRVAHDHIRKSEPDLADCLDRYIDGVNAAAFSMDPEKSAALPALFDATVRLSDASLPEGDPLWPIVADSWISAGYSVWYGPQDEYSLDYFTRAADVLLRELPVGHPTVGETVMLMVDAMNRLGRSEEAERRMRAMVDEMRAVLPASSPRLAQGESVLGETLTARGHFDEAEPLLLRSHAVTLEATGENVFYVAESLRRVVGLYDAWGRPAEAAPWRDELRRICCEAAFIEPWPVVRVAIGPEHEDLIASMEPVLAALGATPYFSLETRVPLESVRAELEAVLAIVEPRFARDDPVRLLLARYFLAWADAIDGLGELRLRLVRESLAVLAPLGEYFPGEIAVGHAQLAELLAHRGQPAEALEHARRAKEMASGRTRDWVLANMKVRASRKLIRLAYYGDAEELLLEALATLTGNFGFADVGTASVRELLAETYRAWGKPEKAAALLAGGPATTANPETEAAGGTYPEDR